MLTLALALVLAQAAPFDPPAAQAAPRPAPAGPVVALEVVQGRTPLGTLRIALEPAKAPVTVENFLQYVRAGFYDGTIFHRVIPGFMIQGGGFTVELEEKPTRGTVKSEARNGLRNSRGAVAMARTNDPDSADSQFFINVRDNHRLDFGIGGAGYTVFGTVIEGMDLVERIVMTPTTSRGQHQSIPQVAVVIRTAREEKAAAPVADPKP
jgi:cyclophilin family peptidyl-prolyl cis-trans isomerase